MKFILILSLCSAISGTCQTTGIHPQKFDTWSECVKAGAREIIKVTEKYEDKVNKQKLVVSYFCNEDHSNKRST
tara:strand:- start:298 stop:519 length:222 start_codon:yes stop_codon:yes gene_type:complete